MAGSRSPPTRVPCLTSYIKILHKKTKVSSMDTSKETIERLFTEQMMMVTRETNRKLRSFDRQFSVGAV